VHAIERNYLMELTVLDITEGFLASCAGFSTLRGGLHRLNGFLGRHGFSTLRGGLHRFHRSHCFHWGLRGGFHRFHGFHGRHGCNNKTGIRLDRMAILLHVCA
jgi:hypothetical protein